MLTAALALSSAALAATPALETTAVQVVAAPDSPVRLDSVKVLNTGSDPPVLLYAATNASDAPLEVFTVMVFVFDSDGRLKARQVAPGRRELAAGETKYSAMVLDVGKIDPTDILMAGVDQAQRAGSETWWRTDLRAIAEKAADAKRAAGAKPRGR
jgi:hypothetical protein